MKRLHRLAPLFLSALLIGCAHHPARHAPASPPRASAPAAYAPPGGGFSVRMPAPPQAQIDPNGSHVYALELGELTYIVGYNDLPASAKLTDAIRDRVLDAAREMMVKKSGVTVISETRVALDRHPGRELELKTREGYFWRLRTAFSGTRLYQVGVVAPMNKSGAPEIARFLDSFRFTRP